MSGINEKGEQESFTDFCKRSLEWAEKQKIKRDQANDELRELMAEGESLLEAEQERRGKSS